ncbi:hypothetical protein C1646_668970 [Rhizophagus diaphanus]|nr:hypothetical protein C1646_668970 [Rhizophagus diaphanus] [Rhizophagus sp. MUCL 43196]
MYFGPGKKVERSQEIWHGNIWKESPRFRCASIKINEVLYNCGDFVVYRESSNRIGRILAIVEVDGELKVTIQHVLQFIELPGNLQSNDRRERSPREVWLFDRNMENALVEVELQTIIKRVVVTILYTEDTIHNNSSVVIREILYKHQGHWKIRNVTYSYRHPSEFAPLEEPETNLPIYKLYIDLYFDDFGTFRNVYHSLSGVYIQIGNLPFDKRKQLKNHFVLEFIPFGGSFEEFIAPFVAEMKTLENRKIMDVQGTKSIVIASLGDITADLPQGNDLVGVKRHSATRGCHTCNAIKDSWTSNNIDLPLISRYHHLTDRQFEEISAAPTITRRNEIAAEYGLWICSPILDNLKRERHLQSPHDVYHAIARKVLRFLRITIDALSPEGKLAFILAWKTFEYPRSWQKLSNPISHIESFMMSDSLRLAMVIPFILNRILKPQNFKQSEIDKFRSQTGVSRSDLVIKLWLIKYWILVTKTMSMAFMHSFTEEDYTKLRECLDNERRLLSQVFI